MMSLGQGIPSEKKETPLPLIENPTHPAYNMVRGDDMSMAEEIMQVVATLPDEQKQTVLDFARFLREKEAREVSAMMKDIVDENLEAFKELAK